MRQTTVRKVLTALSGGVLNTLRTVIGALETITIVMAYLRRWTAPMTPDPPANSFSISGSSAHRGRFTMQIDKQAESAEWPALLSDCAATLGKPAPTLSKEGSPVTWTEVGQESGLISVNRPNGPPYVGSLDAALSDRLDYTTGSESESTAKGVLVTPTITVTAHARRTEIDQLADLLTDYLARNFPPLIQPTIRAVLGSLFGWAKHALDSFTAVDGSTTIEVSHHVPRPQSIPPVAPSCSAGGTAIPAGGTISGPVGSPVIDATLGGAWASLDAPVGQHSGTAGSHARAGLHVIGADCGGITGDVIAMIREIATPVSQYLTIGGSGTWTARRT